MSLLAIINQHRSEFESRRDSVEETFSKESVMIAITVVPVLLLFLIVNLLPIGWAIAAAFHSISAWNPTWTWVGFENFGVILGDGYFWASVWRSVIFAGGSVALQLVAGVTLALLLNRSFKYASFIRAIAMLPYLIPTAILGLIALWMGNSSWGIMGQLAIQAGLTNEMVAWFGNPDWAMIAVILTNSWKFTIFVTIMVLARLQGIPEGYYEAARVSGANAYQQFRDITLPNLKGVIFIVLLLRGMWMFNKFDIIWVLTRGGPNELTTTVPVYLYRVGFVTGRLGEAGAVSALLFVMLAVVAVLYFKFLNPSEEVRVE